MAASAATLLKKLEKIALALPETAVEEFHGHAGFLVRKKTFGYFLNNHHGDGKIGIACRVVKGDQEVLARNDPDRFYLPAYIAHRGWVAMRLDTAKVDWEEVSDLLTGSYVLVAPKKLADAVRATLE